MTERNKLRNYFSEWHLGGDSDIIEKAAEKLVREQLAFFVKTISYVELDWDGANLVAELWDEHDELIYSVRVTEASDPIPGSFGYMPRRTDKESGLK